jgi:hypothetical protein
VVDDQVTLERCQIPQPLEHSGGLTVSFAGQCQQIEDDLQTGFPVLVVGVALHDVPGPVQLTALLGAEVVVGAFAEHRKRPVETDLRAVVVVGDRVPDQFPRPAG